MLGIKKKETYVSLHQIYVVHNSVREIILGISSSLIFDKLCYFHRTTSNDINI